MWLDIMQTSCSYEYKRMELVLSCVDDQMEKLARPGNDLICIVM